jgi:hypothetical protein
MAQIGAFHPDSELMADTQLQDSRQFFTKASEILGFSTELRKRLP